MSVVKVDEGEGPIILAFPHVGTSVPDDVFARLNPRGQALADTDWHVDRPYRGWALDATWVRATTHRYVIDVNRDPSGQSLYPGQNTTDLIPLTDFDGHPIWHSPPGKDDIAQRLATHHAPYHAALAAQIERVKARFGIAMVFDCHSIRSRIPFLFDGVLPDLNVGTNSGASCDPRLEWVVWDACQRSQRYTSVLNGRFKGGWTTRHYGQPKHGVHAIQMEIAQSTYLSAEAPPWEYDNVPGSHLGGFLGDMLHMLTAAVLTLGDFP